MKTSGVYFILWATFCALHICTADSDSQESILTVISEATLAEDGKLNFTQLVIKYGHTVQQYDVVTEDGYILTVFRIPGEKPPILLFHGIGDSGDTYLIRGDISFVITLANAGYEVWVGNNRGTLYGRNHTSLNPDTDEEFWDYSFHEIGYYDLAATIDFILNATGYESISTVGHSQGTTAHFVLTSLRPEYNDKIKVFIALAPIAFLNDLNAPLSLIAAAGPAVATVLKAAGINELLQDNKATSDIITFICSKGVVSDLVCGLGTLFPLAGFDPKNIDQEFLTGVVFGHYPRAVSRKSLEHYDQVVLRRSFAQYDYGKENTAKYGSLSPPEYNLTAVTIKVALFVGTGDNLSTVKNDERLRDSLPNVVHYEVLEPKLWGHLDFVWGNSTPTYLYPPIFNLLEEYNEDNNV